MKKLKLISFLFILTIFANNSVKAQFINIPDNYFANWLIDNYPMCMNGNLMDTTCADITNETIVNVSNWSSLSNQIVSLEGIQYFDHLNKLICYNNNINFIPTLPSTLEILHCGSNNLISLPSLPDSLKYLYCGYNILTSLPTLPLGLQSLWCHHNLLVNLPNLPSSLIKLHCYENQLTSLPIMPPNLSLLSCTNNNNLSSLPTLPNTLDTLKCAFNNLSNLPLLPNSLIGIDCKNNALSQLPVLPTNLRYLDCDNNQISNLPSLPDSLHTLYCNTNQLQNLPNLPSTLLAIYVRNNQLTTIPSLPTIMHTLDCANNAIQILPNLPQNLLHLYCNNNNLSTLPMLPLGLKYLFINNNAINCLPVLPNSLTSIQLTSNPLTCLPNYTSNMGANLLALPICMGADFVNNPNNCASFSGILGSIYSDLNTNCLFDVTEFSMINIPIKLYDSSNVFIEQTNTLLNGLYNFALPTGLYKVLVDTISKPFTINCPQIGIDTNVSLTSSLPLAVAVDFPASCKNGTDLGVKSVIRNGISFPGQLHEVIIYAGDMAQWFGMACASGISGEVIVSINGPVQFVANIGTAIPQVNGNVFSFVISDFGSIANTQAFAIQLLTDSTAQFTDQVCVNVQIISNTNDYNLQNNNFSFCYAIFNSYDPNMKEVFPIELSNGYSDWLTYTIHFQNTGNAPAFNIRLLDTLSSLLDINTFEVIGYSHPNIVNLKGNVLNFKFPNIMLPDSLSNPNGSKGFVQYRIKPLQNLPIGTSITNTAFIYFDFNSAIVTNTTNNIFTTNLPHIIANKIELFPNPAIDKIYVNNISSSTSYCITEISGKIIINSLLNQNKEIDISSLSTGIYFLNFTTAHGIFNTKFIKE